ncbi:MAG: alpha/beta fold hydrolase, partial [Trebonia sp.]
MAEAAADAIELADRLGWERFSVLGHSMGGVAMQHVLDQAPHRVRRLVGVAPVPATGLPLGQSEWGLFISAAGNRASREMIVNHATGSRLGRAFLDLIVRHSRDNSTEEAFGAYL